MKTVLIAIISLLSFSMQSQNRYELQDQGKDKDYLSDFITQMAERKVIQTEPIIVLDGKPYRFQDLEKEKLPLYKNQIEKITLLDKEKGIAIYGNFAEAGVIIVTTNRKKSSNKNE